LRSSQAGAAAQAHVPRIALTRAEAAQAIGMSLGSFERYVQTDLRLVPVKELEHWVDTNAAPASDGRG
jgi:hypothetical protein